MTFGQGADICGEAAGEVRATNGDRSLEIDRLPGSVRYVKNGPGGRWWRAARARQELHLGWHHLPGDLLHSGDYEAIGRANRQHFGIRATATQDTNALLTVLDRPSRHLWVTIEEGCLWWCTVRDGIVVNAEAYEGEAGHFWLSLDTPWRNTSLAGRHLATGDLPGTVTKVAGYQATICQPAGWQEILRIVADETDAEVAAANAARIDYEAALGKLLARLRPKDFEVLVDLVLARTGWTRIARIGGSTEGVDVEVENAATQEIAFVQVKSAAGQTVLDDYVGRFMAQRERYARMIFAVHSPMGALQAPSDSPVQVWDRARLAGLVVQHGLGSWVTKRA